MIRKDTFFYRVIAASGLKLIAAAEWLICKNSPNNTFFDTNAFPWTKTLQSSYPQIKDELHFLLESRSIPDLTKLSEEQKPHRSREQMENVLSFAFMANMSKKTANFVRSPRRQLEIFLRSEEPFFRFLNRARILAAIVVPIRGF